MWCPRCHTEVAAEIAQNGQSLLCTSCGTEIQRIYAPSLHPDTRSARELLERWSKAELGDVTAESPAATSLSETLGTPIPAEFTLSELSLGDALPLAASLVPSSPLGSAPHPAPTHETETPPAEIVTGDSTSGRRDCPERTKPERQTPKPRTMWRVGAARTVTQPAAPPPPSERPEPIRSAVSDSLASEPANRASLGDRPEPESPRTVSPRTTAATNAVQRRLDLAHESLGGPHFDWQAFLAQDKQKPGKSESTWGQVLAYAGVGLITVGTTLVLWSWFGQVAHYAPTGWLICTVGQMLLFLGVTTLISGGMQQTSHEVTRRVEYLGDRILRFEHSADQLLRGPHFTESREQAKQTAQAEDSDLDA